MPITYTVPPDLFPRARQILLPLVATQDEREALLTEAFYLHDPLLYGISRKGSPKVFAVNCLKKLLDHGCLSKGEHSLARLMLIARYDYGVDKHAEIDALISMANALCQSEAHAPRPAAISVPLAGPAPLQTIATPRDERRPTVFISYYHGDADFAKQLIADLSAAGHACWIDTSAIKGGDEWVQTIAEGIINSYALVVIVTFEALQSKWVQKEILWAQQKKKRIVPVILEDVMKETRFFPLVDCLGVTLFDGDYVTALPKLLRSLPPFVLLDVEISEAQPGASRHRPGGVSRKLELAYLERLKLEELLSTEKYTPMGGSTEQRQHRAEMRAVFELLPMGKDSKVQQESRRFENAVEEIHRIRRAVLLGEPGGGKTTTIWKLAADLVEAALQDREAPIPLLIRLGRWTEADQPLHAFIAAQLGDLGDHLDLLLSEKRAALLLDGLNELPASQHQEKYPQVQRFIEQHPKLLAVVSCRELDYTIDLGFDRINITQLDPIRIREFAGRYLGAEKGEALFWQLAGGDNVHKIWEVWQGAGAAFELFWTAQDIPKEDPHVYGITSREQDRVWREKVRGKHTLMVLASNPYMLLMLTSVYAEQGELPENRGELFQLFVGTLLKRERIPENEQTPLTEKLARVAYEMQIRRAPDDKDDAGGALTVLPEDEVNAILGERMLYLAGSASMLSVGEQVRFTHQLLQEYFAAKHMDIEFRAGRLKAAGIWPPDCWWQRTNWEEATILLAGLYSDDCTPIVEWVAEANPEVAARCVADSGAGFAEATGERLRTQWIPRLTDLKRDPEAKARAAVGRALGLTEWDNRKGVGTVEKALGDGRIVPLPDIDWVEIPGGEFLYGDKSESNSPPQKLTLPTFHISRFPVTYAQFQTFLDDPEGCADPRWFDGLAARDDDRPMGEQYFKFANHPRDTVNWYQAMAFCRWFSWRCDSTYDLKKVEEWAVRLPTEYEWEKAARGASGQEGERLYPYEGDFDATKCNTRETGLGQTSAVGIFPNGASPYGVMDMSGNVWEWCLSDYDKPALEAWKEDMRTENTRVLRGGSWNYFLDFARAVFRVSEFPDFRFNDVGFRVVCGVRPPSL
jgi:formylglycine-generating enzyme required for sulfatase activity